MRKEIGFRVKQARENANLTQEKLAEKAGVSTSFISRLENGNALQVLTGSICWPMFWMWAFKICCAICSARRIVIHPLLQMKLVFILI